MRYSYYILKVLGAVALIMAASSCVKSDVEYETYGGDISIAPVTSAATKSIPGAITGTTYPQGETMGVFAYRNPGAEPDVPWDADAAVVPYVYYKNADGSDLTDGEGHPLNNMAAEFGYRTGKGAWGGIFSTLSADKKTTDKKDQPHIWPETGSLIFAGISPYYKFQAVDVNHQTVDGTLKPLKEMAVFDVATRTLEVKGYTVGQYIPMTAEQIADPEHEYINTSQSDAMFFMPKVKGGKYVGVNKLSAYPARFYHALSLVEFKVRAEDDYDMDRVHIDRITLDQVYHTGDFSARVNDDGSITAGWTNLKGQDDIHIFGDEGGHDGTAELLLDMDLRSVAQLLIIPGPTHPITVGCHVYTMGKYYNQTFVVDPEDVGITKWEMGKRYVYNLIIGLNKIEFAPEAYDWNDVDGGGYSKPAKD
jgi:hypothetical protein